jgi:hypothetical protein
MAFEAKKKKIKNFQKRNKRPNEKMGDKNRIEISEKSGDRDSSYKNVSIRLMSHQRNNLIFICFMIKAGEKITLFSINK